MPAGDELNNREWATLFWLVVFAAWLISRKDIRAAVLNVVRAAVNPVLLGPFVALLIWIALTAWLASRLQLWNSDLIKDTAIWAVGPALAQYMKVSTLGQQPRFVRRVAVGALKYSVFIDFYINLYVLSFPAELLLVPLVTVLAMLAVIAGRDKRYRVVEQIVDFSLRIVGTGLLAFVTINLVNGWQHLDRLHDLREVLLPIWLTLAVLPFLYGLSLYANYQQAFTRIGFAAIDRRVPWRIKLAVIFTLNFRTYVVSRLTWPWLGQLAEAGSFADARRIVGDFARHAPS